MKASLPPPEPSPRHGLTAREPSNQRKPNYTMKRTIYSLLTIGLLAAGRVPSATAAPAGDPADLAQIAAVGEAYAKAFEKGDAKAVAAFWTPAGDYVDQSGKVFKGRDAIEAVFKPFFRLEQSRNRRTGGMGLGLANTRTIARAHGGDVSLENRVEGGLRAIVSLPDDSGATATEEPSA